MKKLILLLLFTVQLTHAQLITFRVTDGTGPIVGATLFLRLNDKSYVGATDNSGIAQISLKKDFTYKIRVSMMGFETLDQEITINKTEFKVTLKASATELNEVSVKARKPLITHEDDKAIVDTEPLVQSSTNVMEVLEKIPGVFSDSEGGFYLGSAAPAKIYINGREQRMDASDLATILKSLPPNAIEKVEIIRTPSATMDASNTGGSLNIILRKGYSLLGSGSISAGMNQGNYGNQFLNASYNKSIRKISYYVNGGISSLNSFSFFSNNRHINGESFLNSESRIASANQNQSLGYGISLDIKKNWSVTYDGRVSNSGTKSTNNTSAESFFNQERVFSNVNQILTEGNRLFVSQNLSSIIKFDSAGAKNLLLDFSGTSFKPNNNQIYSNTFYRDSKEFSGNNGAGQNLSSSDFYAVRVELTYPFKNKFKLETGGKLSVMDYNSQANYTRTEDGATALDLFRNNGFDFSNRITALYVQGTKRFGKFSLKTGLRLENTFMFGHQKIPSDTTFKVQRSDLFPFLFFGRKIASIMGMEMRGTLVAQRTIDRPGYSQLNPFRRYIDEFTYQSGNPALKPKFADNYEFNLNIAGQDILAVGQKHISNVFTDVIYQDPKNPQIVNRTYDNLSKNKETYFRIMGAIPPGGKYFFVAGAQFSLNEYSGIYEKVPINFRRGSWRFFTFHELKIDKKSTFTLQGILTTKGQMQFTELGNFGSLNAGINRRFLDDRLVVSLSANDVLFTNKYNFKINQGSMIAAGFQSSDSRRFGLNVRYNFGRKKRIQNGFGLDMPDGEGNIE